MGESFVVEAALGGCILDREAEDVWRRSGGGGGIGGKTPAAGTAAAAGGTRGPLRWRPVRY